MQAIFLSRLLLFSRTCLSLVLSNGPRASRSQARQSLIPVEPPAFSLPPTYIALRTRLIPFSLSSPPTPEAKPMPLISPFAICQPSLVHRAHASMISASLQPSGGAEPGGVFTPCQTWQWAERQTRRHPQTSWTRQTVSPAASLSSGLSSELRGRSRRPTASEMPPLSP